MMIAHALRHVLNEGKRPAWLSDDALAGPDGHALNRLLSALEAGASKLDRAVLVRQCLRRVPADARVVVPTLRADDAEQFDRVGVRQSLDGSLHAHAFLPEWVASACHQAVDLPRSNRGGPDQAIPGEPWLQRLLGTDRWKSAAQREATWHALNAPPNSTVLVGLPTGSGKSLVAQCCAAFESGLTVLVVPTVALGIDQLAAVRALPCSSALEPMLYPGEDAESALGAIEGRRCRLLITSPEAIVSGRLRGLLRRHASEGFLQRLVIDEAHLIESWGADFRVEFQLLGAVLRAWRSEAPAGIRTLLLSATFTPSAPGMLQEMFAGGGSSWQQHIVQRLRPEIHYFTASRWAAADEQHRWVEEALFHLPRPAILYVTERAEAEAWGARVGAMGFERFRVFHGDTKPGDREATMRAWRADRLDLVVATSAFGMGVDKPDVRAIVHACFPEGIDRFYQEVGRGGRDGDPCVSVLVPTRRDLRVALSMGFTLLKDPRKIDGRWEAMWRSRKTATDANNEPTSSFRIRADVQPEHRFGQQSYAENVRWNKRLLLMMERARLIRLEGLDWDSGADDERVEWVTLRPLVPTVSLHPADLLAEPRRVEQDAMRRAADSMLRHFDGTRAVCRELRDHYGKETRRACGSCASCRTGEEEAVGLVSLHFDSETLVTQPRVQLVPCPALNDPSAYSELVQAVRQLLQSAEIPRFVVPSRLRIEVERIFEHAERGGARPYRMDDLDEEVAMTVEPHERLVVLHSMAIDKGAAMFNSRGSSVAHWLLGGARRAFSGSWPFMYDHQAKLEDSLASWLHDQQRMTQTRSGTR